jgi:hypothetical protein
MEPTEGKPVRKRRRWLILTFVLVLVSGGVWWYWPRGDARLVGKWRFSQVDGTAGVMTLHANGSGCSELSPTYRSRFAWRVEDGRLITGSDFEGFSLRCVEWISNQIFARTGTNFMFGRYEQEIVEVTPERMVLRDGPDADAAAMGGEGGGSVSFERIPE